jgi:ribose-phosphate pyrophosphokinase
MIDDMDEDFFLKHMDIFMKKYYISPYSKKHNFILFSGNSNKELAQELGIALKVPLGKVTIVKQDNGESFIKIHENVNNRHIIILQSISPPVHDNLLELLFLISALKRESAKSIIVVIPYFAYSTKTEPKGKTVPLSAQLIIRLLEGLGADHVVAIELHSKHITVIKSNTGFFLNCTYYRSRNELSGCFLLHRKDKEGRH